MTKDATCLPFVKADKPPHDHAKSCKNSRKTKDQLLENSHKLISITPRFLKFSHDDKNNQSARITIWNKTNRNVRLRVTPPSSPIFQIKLEKNILNGNEETHITVRCNPCSEKFCFDSIGVTTLGIESKIVTIPLELLPSFSWFNMPRNIKIPLTPLGTCAKSSIKLPIQTERGKPPYFFIRSLNTDAFTVEPREGNFESSGAEIIEKITVRFTPKEYALAHYKLEICFPEFGVNPFEISISGDCLPAVESQSLISHTKKLEEQISSLIWDEHRRKLQFYYPRMRLASRGSMGIQFSQEGHLEEANLSTHSGVMKYLSRKSDAGALYSYSSQRYSQNLSGELQPVEVYEKFSSGETYVYSSEVHADQNANIEQLDGKHIKRKEPKEITEIREMIPDKEELKRKLIKKRFVQAVLIVITRRRADKRIRRLKRYIKKKWPEKLIF